MTSSPDTTVCPDVLDRAKPGKDDSEKASGSTSNEVTDNCAKAAQQGHKAAIAISGPRVTVLNMLIEFMTRTYQS